MEKIKSLAQQQQSFSLVVDILILQGKFALIEGDLSTASKFLDQANLTAEEKGLGLLAEKVATERQQLVAEWDTWQRLIQTNAPFSERIETARLAEYIKTAQKLIPL